MKSVLPSSDPGKFALLDSASRRVTVKDVAARAGASHSAVSMVLNGARAGNTGASDAVRARILDAARELGYRRNGNMAAARSGCFKAVGLLLSTHENTSTVHPSLWIGINQALRDEDLHLIVQQSPDDRLTDADYVPKMLREWMCDGLLIDYTHGIPPRMLRLIEQNAVPAVWLNSDLEFDCISPDNYRAAHDATLQLQGLGHERILFSSYLLQRELRDQHYSTGARWAGYRAAMLDSGLAHREFAPMEQASYREKIAQFSQLLIEEGGPTAVLCYGGLDSDLVMHAAELAGLEVPGDLSVVTFASGAHNFHGLTVTAWMVPEEEVGRAAVGQLLCKIRDPAVPLPSLRIPFTYLPGNTVAEAPADRAVNFQPSTTADAAISTAAKFCLAGSFPSAS